MDKWKRGVRISHGRGQMRLHRLPINQKRHNRGLFGKLTLEESDLIPSCFVFDSGNWLRLLSCFWHDDREEEGLGNFCAHMLVQVRGPCVTVSKSYSFTKCSCWLKWGHGNSRENSAIMFPIIILARTPGFG